jgi:hypothetical protein
MKWFGCLIESVHHKSIFLNKFEKNSIFVKFTWSCQLKMRWILNTSLSSTAENCQKKNKNEFWSIWIQNVWTIESQEAWVYKIIRESLNFLNSLIYIRWLRRRIEMNYCLASKLEWVLQIPNITFEWFLFNFSIRITNLIPTRRFDRYKIKYSILEDKRTTLNEKICGWFHSAKNLEFRLAKLSLHSEKYFDESFI